MRDFFLQMLFLILKRKDCIGMEETIDGMRKRLKRKLDSNFVDFSDMDSECFREEAAMCDEDEFIAKNSELNDIIDYIAAQGDRIGSWNIDKEEQMRATSRSLSEEMIYTKFLQGQLIIGIAGGVFDPIYVNRISNYAVLKYRRRFLGSRLQETEK